MRLWGGKQLRQICSTCGPVAPFLVLGALGSSSLLRGLWGSVGWAGLTSS